MLDRSKRNVNLKCLETLKNETIKKYTEEIDFDQPLSLYDVMIEHFAKGDLDNVFKSPAFEGLDDNQKKELMALGRKYQSLCFYKGKSEYWLDSLEGASVVDYNLIAFYIVDSFSYLLQLAKEGGEEVLKQLTTIRNNSEFPDNAIVEYLRTTVVDDRVLTSILLDMTEEDSPYNIFTDKQKATLLNYPDGTLYFCQDDTAYIVSPLLLGAQIHNTFDPDNYIDTVSEDDSAELVSGLKQFFRSGDIDFVETVVLLSDKYRDFAMDNDFEESSQISRVKYDLDGGVIQEAWLVGDGMLGGSYDAVYFK